MAQSWYPSMDLACRIALSKRVPCRYRPCSAPVDVACTNTSDGPNRGRPLGGLGAHLVRLEDAQADRDARSSVAPSPRSFTEQSRELTPA